MQTLIDTYGVKNINLEDDGSIQIESFSAEKNELVKAAILKIVVTTHTYIHTYILVHTTYIHTYIHTYCLFVHTFIDTIVHS